MTTSMQRTEPAWSDQHIDIDGLAPIPARWYAPADGGAGPVALVLHLHGGAFVSGGVEQGRLCASLLAQAGAGVLSIAYPLAPEHPFPSAAETAHAALLWLQEHRHPGLPWRGAAAVPLMVAGEEAGGNLAAATALMARDRCGPALAGQILMSPMLDLCVASASWRDATSGRGAPCAWAEGWRVYLQRAGDCSHPYATPSHSMRLQGLPPALLITARDDPLRDEALAYAQRLRQADVPVTQAVLDAATGWPTSYRDAAAPTPTWAEPLLKHLRCFLHERRALFLAAQSAIPR